MNDINTLDDSKEKESAPIMGALARWLDHHQPSKSAVLMGTALLVGLGTAVGLLAFHELLSQPSISSASLTCQPSFLGARTHSTFCCCLFWAACWWDR